MALKDINVAKIKKGALFTLVGIALVAILSLTIYSNFTYSEGTRNGTVIKLSKKGVMFKTYEGQLNVGAYVKDGTNNMPTSIWEFSVPKSNQEVLDGINEAIDKGKRVKLHYKEKLNTLPWRGDTNYLIYKVEIIN
jgi:hypothetical protein